MSASLLRPEAVLARLQGQPQLPLARPRLGWLLMACVAFLAAAGLTAVTASYGRSVRAPGELLADVAPVPLRAAAPGRVSHVAVAEGDTVAAGELLLTVADTRFAGGRAVTADIDALQARRSRDIEREQLRLHKEFADRDAALAARRRDLLEVTARNARVALLARRRAVLSAAELERLRPLQAGGHIAAQDWRQRESAHLAHLLEAERAAAEEQRAAGELAAIDAARIALAGEAQGRRAALADALLVIAAERLQSNATAREEIRAPVEGRVAALRVGHGHPVAAGSALLTLLPVSPVRGARLYVPEHAVAAVRPGAQVWLDVPGLGKGGEPPLAAQVSERGEAPVSQWLDGRALAAPSIPVTVVLAAPAPDGLLPGMTVSAQLLEEQRTLARWFTKPFEDVRRRLEPGAWRLSDEAMKR